MTEPSAEQVPQEPHLKTTLAEFRKEADEACEKTLASLTELIIATLKAPLSGRFVEARKLCDLAQSLIQTRGQRVEAFAKAGDGGGLQLADNNLVGAQVVGNPVIAVNNAGGAAQVYNVVAGYNGGLIDANPVNPVGNPIRRAAAPGQIQFDDQGRLVDERGIAFTGSLDANALMRHMLVTFGPHAQTGAEANRAKVAHEEADELNVLAGLIVGGVTDPEKSVIERRIKQLMMNMEMRTNANGKPEPDEPQKELPVVSPDDPRGHPVGEGGAEADDREGVRADDGGAARHGGAAQAGPLDPMGANPVG